MKTSIEERQELANDFGNQQVPPWFKQVCQANGMMDGGVYIQPSEIDHKKLEQEFGKFVCWAYAQGYLDAQDGMKKSKLFVTTGYKN